MPPGVPGALPSNSSEERVITCCLYLSKSEAVLQLVIIKSEIRIRAKFFIAPIINHLELLGIVNDGKRVALFNLHSGYIALKITNLS